MSFLLAAIVVFVGASVQTTAGFGMNALAAPLLLVISPELVPAPLLISHLALTLSMSAAEMHHTQRRVLAWAIVGAVPGIAFGAWLLGVFTIRQLTLTAVIVLALAAFALVTGIRFGSAPSTLMGAGFVSGVFGTTISVNGPPLALATVELSGPARRGTLATYLTITTVLALVALALVGKLPSASLLRGAYLIPPALLGYYVSSRTTRHLDRLDPRFVIVPVALFAVVVAALRVL